MGRKHQEMFAHSIILFSYHLELLTTMFVQTREGFEFDFYHKGHFPFKTGGVWLVVYGNNAFHSGAAKLLQPLWQEALDLLKMRRNASTGIRRATK